MPAGAERLLLFIRNFTRPIFWCWKTFWWPQIWISRGPPGVNVWKQFAVAPHPVWQYWCDLKFKKWFKKKNAAQLSIYPASFSHIEPCNSMTLVTRVWGDFGCGSAAASWSTSFLFPAPSRLSYSWRGTIGTWAVPFVAPFLHLPWHSLCLFFLLFTSLPLVCFFFIPSVTFKRELPT